jgi:peptidoglycan/xylan/chitin deacetylase (PgdA/CDA1 family)
MHAHKASPLTGLQKTLLQGAAQGAATLLSSRASSTRLTILIYHRVLAEPDPLLSDIVDRKTFDTQMSALKACFHVLPLREAIERLRKSRLPARTACITFDDGYADNVTQALPVLQRHGLQATFFVASDFLDGKRMFNDTVIEAIRRAPVDAGNLTDMGLGHFDFRSPQSKASAIRTLLPRIKYLPQESRKETVETLTNRLTREPLPDDLMMTTPQLKSLHAAGMEIGGHTASHPILSRLTVNEARDEICRGKEALESILPNRVRLFAYPNGKPIKDYYIEHAEIVRELGFLCAVTTAWGTATRKTDPYQLPRFSPWSGEPKRFILMLLRNLVRGHPEPRLLV